MPECSAGRLFQQPRRGAIHQPQQPTVRGTDHLRREARFAFALQDDLEDLARQFAVDVLGGKISPDMLLHGASAKGFGIPALADMLGHSVGVAHLPIPVTDLHSSISMGNILPFEPGNGLLRIVGSQLAGCGSSGLPPSITVSDGGRSMRLMPSLYSFTR